MPETVFVYGTLRSGGAASRMLTACERVGAGTLRGTLYDVDGRYPALVLEGAGPVSGEIWECPASVLAQLDAYEGVGEGLFRRKRVEVGGRPCWTYVAGPLLRSRLRADRVLPAGEWPPRG